MVDFVLQGKLTGWAHMVRDNCICAVVTWAGMDDIKRVDADSSKILQSIYWSYRRGAVGIEVFEPLRGNSLHTPQQVAQTLADAFEGPQVDLFGWKAQARRQWDAQHQPAPVHWNAPPPPSGYYQQQGPQAPARTPYGPPPQGYGPPPQGYQRRADLEHDQNFDPSQQQAEPGLRVIPGGKANDGRGNGGYGRG